VGLTVAIQDLVASYGMGQDLHQAGQDNDVLSQWENVFAPDAVIDTGAVGAPSAMNLREYAELCVDPPWTARRACRCATTPGSIARVTPR
jgi:hypothetical protein